jgi:hypothetical protein
LAKIKTSIYIDKNLWEKLKSVALKNGLEVSQMLEEIIKNEIIEDFLEQVLERTENFESYEIDFEPLEPEKGFVSEFIRVMRNERSNNIS